MAGKAKLLRGDLVRRYGPVRDLRRHSRAGDGDLIEAVDPMHYERLLRTKLPQGLGDRPHIVAMEDAHELSPGPGRVGQGTEEVEDSPEGQFGSYGGDVAHRRVVGASEHEAYAHLFYTLADFFWSEPYLRAKSLQDVRGAGLAGSGPVAVFG